MTERTPLLHYRLFSSVESELRAPPASQAPEQLPGSPRQRATQRQPKKLSIFFGVVIPTLLSMFSVVVFLRIGKCSRWQTALVFSEPTAAPDPIQISHFIRFLACWIKLQDKYNDYSSLPEPLFEHADSPHNSVRVCIATEEERGRRSQEFKCVRLKQGVSMMVIVCPFQI